MKTIQELYNEVMANEELKAQFIEAANAGKLEALLKEQGCEATLEEVAAFLKAKDEEDAPLSLDELENSAGGGCNDLSKTDVDKIMSCCSFGLACAVTAITSAATGYVGQRKEGDSRICTET